MKKVLVTLTAFMLFTAQAFAVDVKAKRVSIDDTGGYFSSSNVEEVLQEVGSDLSSVSSAWGNITGTLSNQTDLQSALNAKVSYTGASADVNIGANSFITSGDGEGFFAYNNYSDVSNYELAEMKWSGNVFYIDTQKAGSGTNRSLVLRTGTGATMYQDSDTILFRDASYNTRASIDSSGLNVASLTASQLVSTDGSKYLQSLDTATYPSLTELSYVKGVTSSIQTQLNAKQAADDDLTTYAGITPSANIQSFLASADYSAARTNLGLAIGTNVQAYDSDLTTYAGITPSANVQSLLGAADYSAMRTQLSLVPGTDVQAQDSELSALAGLTSAADKIPYFTGSGTAGLVTIGSGLSFSGGTLSASSAGDVESVGDCTTGACFDGTSGTTITFDTNGGTYGFDGTIAYSQSNNYWTFTNSGFDDAGSAYWPVVSFTGNGTNSFGYNHFKAKTAGNQLIVGSNHNGYGFIVAHDGVSNGGGLAFYQNTVYPTDVNGTSAAFINAAGATPTNNVMAFGDSSYRFANMYSVAANLSGALSFVDTGTYSQTGAITYGGSNNNWTFTAPGINDAGSGYPPAWLFTIHASSTGLNPAGIMKIEGGGQRNYPLYLGSSYKGAVVMGRQGSSTAQIGAGLSFGYGEGTGNDTNRTSIMPIRLETGEIADPTIVNDVVTLGSASYRFKNFYGVLGNFSGIVTMSGAQLTTTTVASLGTATAGLVKAVTNAADATDCTAGGGSTFNVCVGNGSTWQDLT